MEKDEEEEEKKDVVHSMSPTIIQFSHGGGNCSHDHNDK